MLRIFCSLFATLVVFGVSVQGLGFRHLWQDELETAERAKSILHFGIPKVVDDEGRISVNAAGLEIEDSDIHRYTPWLQFYIGAAGLKWPFTSKADFNLRLPFTIFHAASTGLITWGSIGLAAIHPVLATTLGIVWGINSVRLAHNRTARYHAVLDFLWVLCLFLLALSWRSSIYFWWAGIVLVLLFHAHTLAGLGATGVALTLLFSRHFKIESWWRPIVITTGIGFLALLMLTRPWLQAKWGGLTAPIPTSFVSPMLLPYWICCLALAIYFHKVSDRLMKKRLIFCVLVSFVIIIILSLHPFSQVRYYLWLMFLPLGFLWQFSAELKPQSKNIFVSCLLITVVSTEFFTPTEQPYQMLLVIQNDKNWAEKNALQPLREATALVGEGAVLWDYVPQFINWYLPHRSIALMPDSTTIDSHSSSNPLMKTGPLPDYHIWYSNFPNNWVCMTKCDSHIEDLDETNSRYKLAIVHQQKTLDFCILKSFETDQWNNAPFSMLRHDALNLEGKHSGRLIVAKRCDR